MTDQIKGLPSEPDWKINLDIGQERSQQLSSDMSLLAEPLGQPSETLQESTFETIQGRMHQVAGNPDLLESPVCWIKTLFEGPGSTIGRITGLVAAISSPDPESGKPLTKLDNLSTEEKTTLLAHAQVQGGQTRDPSERDIIAGSVFYRMLP
jgi:hypothetical protein